MYGSRQTGAVVSPAREDQGQHVDIDGMCLWSREDQNVSVCTSGLGVFVFGQRWAVHMRTDASACGYKVHMGMERIGQTKDCLCMCFVPYPEGSWVHEGRRKGGGFQACDSLLHPHTNTHGGLTRMCVLERERHLKALVNFSKTWTTKIFQSITLHSSHTINSMHFINVFHNPGVFCPSQDRLCIQSNEAHRCPAHHHVPPPPQQSLTSAARSPTSTTLWILTSIQALTPTTAHYSHPPQVCPCF